MGLHIRSYEDSIISEILETDSERWKSMDEVAVDAQIQNLDHRLHRFLLIFSKTHNMVNPTDSTDFESSFCSIYQQRFGFETSYHYAHILYN